MKAKLEFNLYKMADKRAHLRATKSFELALALNSIMNRLRDTEKHGKEHLTQEELSNMISDYGIDLYDMLN